MPAPALITQLIDRRDNLEIIQDKIAEILLVESTNQQALARAAGKDPALWKLRVFSSRTNAWEQFQDPPDASNPDVEFDSTPIVNIAFDQATFDAARGDIHERQAADGTYFIDCFGLGISKDDPNGVGHFAADVIANDEASRAYRLVRSILMAAAYITLGYPLKPNPIVWKRWVQSIQFQTVGPSEHCAQHVCGARLTLAVTFNEFSPQIQGVPLELISTGIKRAETGEIFIAADFPIGA